MYKRRKQQLNCLLAEHQGRRKPSFKARICKYFFTPISSIAFFWDCTLLWDAPNRKMETDHNAGIHAIRNYLSLERDILWPDSYSSAVLYRNNPTKTGLLISVGKQILYYDSRTTVPVYECLWGFWVTIFHFLNQVWHFLHLF